MNEPIRTRGRVTKTFEHYGFIRLVSDEDGQQDVFVHQGAVVPPEALVLGAVLDFDLTFGPRGMRAENARPVTS